jgi:hypothetical protein
VLLKKENRVMWGSVEKRDNIQLVADKLELFARYISQAV